MRRITAIVIQRVTVILSLKQYWMLLTCTCRVCLFVCAHMYVYRYQCV